MNFEREFLDSLLGTAVTTLPPCSASNFSIRAWAFSIKRRAAAGNGREHVWLRQNDIVIDITADQFDEGQAKVIVTRHSPWHAASQLAESMPTDEAMLNRSRNFYAKQYPVYPLILTNVKP